MLNLVGLRGTLHHNEAMSQHTTWRVGGPAEWFYKPADLTDLAECLSQIPDVYPIFFLGLGSNILVRDGGIRGVVILTTGLLNELSLLNDTTIYVEAGVSSSKLARFSVNSGLTGIEFLAGIPGTFGGALAMNAGAWGGETWSSVIEIQTLDRQGRPHRRLVTDYDIAYRSVTGPINEWFVAATLQLTPQTIQEGKAKIKALLKQRNEKQPIGMPTCGSVFRNPTGDYAARLIEQAGLKGYCIGAACVSKKHANFIINNGNTAADIEHLIEHIKNSVKLNSGIILKTEVCRVGET